MRIKGGMLDRRTLKYNPWENAGPGIPFLLVISVVLLIGGCDLDRIEDDTGAGIEKFATVVGGNNNDYPRDLVVDADGAIVIAGQTQSFTSDQNSQAYMVKLDKQGTQLWEKHFGGDATDYAEALVPSASGGYIFCGTTRSFNPNDNADLYIVKVNAQGGEVWAKFYGSQDSTEFGFGLCELENGDILVGYRSSLAGTPDQIRLMRLNQNGTRIWDRMLLSGSYFMTDLVNAGPGAIAVSGSYSPSGTEMYIGKFSDEGGYIWHQTFPGTEGSYTPSYDLALFPDNALVLAGSQLGNSDHDFLTVAYSEIGMSLLAEPWGGANADELISVTPTQDGHFIVAGYTSSFSGTFEIYLSKRDRDSGVEIWEKHFGPGWTQGTFVAACPDGGFAVVSGENQANADIVVFKTDNNGDYQ